MIHVYKSDYTGEWRLAEKRGGRFTGPDQPLADRFPLLTAHLVAETIRIDGRDYLGRAIDGTEVRVGGIGEEQDTEAYLAANGPEQW